MSIKILLCGDKSTKASEESKMPGDNALFSVMGWLKKHTPEYDILGTFTAMDHRGKPISIQERMRLSKQIIQTDILLVFGDDTFRSVSKWVPRELIVKVPSAYYYFLSPEKLQMSLLVKIEEGIQKMNINTRRGVNNVKTFGL